MNVWLSPGFNYNSKRCSTNNECVQSHDAREHKLLIVWESGFPMKNTGVIPVQ